MLSAINRYVIGRENNVIRVNFCREPDPPAPCFPGANGLRLSHVGCEVGCGDSRLALVHHAGARI
jgi:hypothetical protein